MFDHNHHQSCHYFASHDLVLTPAHEQWKQNSVVFQTPPDGDGLQNRRLGFKNLVKIIRYLGNQTRDAMKSRHEKGYIILQHVRLQQVAEKQVFIDSSIHHAVAG